MKGVKPRSIRKTISSVLIVAAILTIGFFILQTIAAMKIFESTYPNTP